MSNDSDFEGKWALILGASSGFGADFDGGLHASQLVRVWQPGNCLSGQIVVEEPRPGATVKSPIAVRGKALGNWFFEGDFPLLLLD